MTVILSPSERSYIVTGLAHPTSPTRLDGRQLHQSRAISISYGDAPQASGSARVVLGGTEVLAGIRVEVGDEGEDWRCRVEVDVCVRRLAKRKSDLSYQNATGISSAAIVRIELDVDSARQYYLGPLCAIDTANTDRTAVKVSTLLPT